MSDDLDHHPLRIPSPPRESGRGSTLAAMVSGAVGALLLVAGYWGVSDTTVPGDQLPYFASSTLPGLALVALTVVLLIRREHERDREELRALTARFDAVIDWLANDAAGTSDSTADNGSTVRTVPER
jgi:hypothetical protein